MPSHATLYPVAQVSEDAVGALLVAFMLLPTLTFACLVVSAIGRALLTVYARAAERARLPAVLRDIAPTWHLSAPTWWRTRPLKRVHLLGQCPPSTAVNVEPSRRQSVEPRRHSVEANAKANVPVFSTKI